MANQPSPSEIAKIYPVQHMPISETEATKLRERMNQNISAENIIRTTEYNKDVKAYENKLANYNKEVAVYEANLAKWQQSNIDWEKNNPGEKLIISNGQITGVESSVFQQSMNLDTYNQRLNDITKALPIEKTVGWTSLSNPQIAWLKAGGSVTVDGFNLKEADISKKFYISPFNGKKIEDLNAYYKQYNIPTKVVEENVVYDSKTGKPLLSGAISGVTSEDLLNLVVAGRLLGTGIAGIPKLIGIVGRKPISEVTFTTLQKIIPTSGVGFTPSGLPIGVARAVTLTAALSVPYVGPIIGTAIGASIIESAIKNPIQTTKDLYSYARANPYEMISYYPIATFKNRLLEVKARNDLLNKIDDELVKNYGKNSKYVTDFRNARELAFGKTKLPKRTAPISKWTSAQLKVLEGNPKLIRLIDSTIGKYKPVIIGSSTLIPQLLLERLRRGLLGDIDVQTTQRIINNYSKVMAEELYKTLKRNGYDVKFDTSMFEGHPKYHVTLKGQELLNAGTSAEYFFKTQLGPLRGLFEFKYLGQTVRDPITGINMGTLRGQLRIKLIRGYESNINKLETLEKRAKTGDLIGREKDILDVMDIVEGTKPLYKEGIFIGEIQSYSFRNLINEVRLIINERPRPIKALIEYYKRYSRKISEFIIGAKEFLNDLKQISLKNIRDLGIKIKKYVSTLLKDKRAIIGDYRTAEMQRRIRIIPIKKLSNFLVGEEYRKITLKKAKYRPPVEIKRNISSYLYSKKKPKYAKPVYKYPVPKYKPSKKPVYRTSTYNLYNPNQYKSPKPTISKYPHKPAVPYKPKVPYIPSIPILRIIPTFSPITLPTKKVERVKRISKSEKKKKGKYVIRPTVSQMLYGVRRLKPIKGEKLTGFEFARV